MFGETCNIIWNAAGYESSFKIGGKVGGASFNIPFRLPAEKLREENLVWWPWFEVMILY